MPLRLPQINGGAVARGFATRQVRRRLDTYLSSKGIGEEELRLMVEKGVSLSQVIPKEDLVGLSRYRNLSQVLEPWDMNALLPEWALRVTQSSPQGLSWLKAQGAWLRDALKGGIQ